MASCAMARMERGGYVGMIACHERLERIALLWSDHHLAQCFATLGMGRNGTGLYKL
jgi:hypothetical protein